MSRCENCIHWEITMTLEGLRCWKETALWLPGNTHVLLCSDCIEKVMEDFSTPQTQPVESHYKGPFFFINKMDVLVKNTDKEHFFFMS